MRTENADFNDALEVHKAIPEFDESYLLNNRDRLDRDDAIILVSFQGGEKSGYCISYDRYEDGSLYMWMSGVKPEFRRQGVMTALLEETENLARSKDYEKLKIKTENRRKGMRKLLVEEGFDIIDLDTKEDVKKNKFLLEKRIE